MKKKQAAFQSKIAEEKVGQSPVGPTGFSPIPLQRLPFPSIVVASSDDPYVTPARARQYADAWNSRFVLLENAGHINVASGYGAWPEAYALLNALRSTAPRVV
jgi:predicted alpha/beta hydrolase family esterase